MKHDEQFVIFANVGTAGRTGADYDNEWTEDGFRWFHQSGSHVGQQSVQELLEPGRIVHLLWRTDNRGPFTYAGRVSAHESFETTPVEILWVLLSDHLDEDHFPGPDEISTRGMPEGHSRRVEVNRYERSTSARDACIGHYGPVCAVCSFSFEERYGDLGAGYIHVHHLRPLSEVGENYSVDPIHDLRPICPNCHAMIHLHRPPLSIDELKARLLA